MKNRFKILMIAALATLAGTSCNTFLDSLPDNRTEIDTEDKVAKILVGAYPSATYMLYLRYMSDDYDMLHLKYDAHTERWVDDAWMWKDDQDEGNDSPKNTWEAHYSAIAHANEALAAIERMGNPKSMNPQRGEALVARAYNHFRLVNIFCQHYDPNYSGADLGIPYATEPETDVNPQYDRGTVQSVYEKIERDLLVGLPLIDDTVYDVPKYHFNRLAALGFAAEFYLYYRDYDKCIEYANKVMGDNPESMMRDLSTFSELPIYEPQCRAYVAADVNANLLLTTNYSLAGLGIGYGQWQRYNNNSYIYEAEGLASPSVLWRVDGENASDFARCFLMPTYGLAIGGGPRANLRFSVPYLFEMTDAVMQTGYAHSIQIAVNADNVLLCRAEANVMKNELEAAMVDINHWVKMRMVDGYNSAKTVAEVTSYYANLPFYTPTEPTAKKPLMVAHNLSSDQENMIHALLHIRRIEFHDEGARWFDIKRWGIELTRRIASNEGLVVHPNVKPLVYRDVRQAIQIPRGAIMAGLPKNPR